MTTTSSALHRMRRWIYAPMVAAIAAGTVCTGIGIADAEVNVDAATERAASGIGTYAWWVVNATGKTVASGHFCKMENRGGNPKVDAPDSALKFGGDTPWDALTPGNRTADAFLTVKPDGALAPNLTSGTIDIDGVRWAPQRWIPANVDSDRWWVTHGTDWRHVWIFWDESTHTPFLTREGGGENIQMERTNDDPCALDR